MTSKQDNSKHKKVVQVEVQDAESPGVSVPVAEAEPVDTGDTGAQKVDPAELLLSKLRDVNARGVPKRLQRAAITQSFLDTVPQLSFVWVYDRSGASDVPQYKSMGYEIFTIPPGYEPDDICPAATRDGTRLRLDDCLLMYTTKERVQEIMSAIQNSLRMAKIEQSDLIGTGDGKDGRPSGKETEFEIRPREPLTQDQVLSILEGRNKQ